MEGRIVDSSWRCFSPRRTRRPRSAPLAAVLPALLLAGCSGGAPAGEGQPEQQERVSELKGSATTVTGADVLGFESKSGWTVSSGSVALTSNRTQGSAALAITAPQNYTTLVSAKLASGTAGLAAISDTGATVALDFQQPTLQPNPSYLGAVQLYLSCPSKSIYNQYLGQVDLTGKPLGVFQTLSFTVPDGVRHSLANATYSDLTFTIALNAPAGARGTYIVDNLRCKSPATEPVGAGSSVDLVALLQQSPPQNTPGIATFTPGTVQIPASFHIKTGNAGSGTARLDIGLAASSAIACTYKASADKTAYVFDACAGVATGAGDIIPAGYAKLTIVSADPAAALTKIKAQLAYNPLGDRVGKNLLPAIPTFWGETANDINTIVSAFFQAQVDHPPTQETFVSLPIPDFALRHGDGSAVDGNAPPPADPSDPAFNKSGHMNQGGWVDAYWQLQGSISPAQQGSNFKSHFDATASAHAVIASHDISVLSVNTTIDTDSGQTSTGGFTNPSSHGTLGVFVFGSQVANEQADQTTGFSFHPSVTQTYDAPPIPIWIFSITAGVKATAGIDTTGTLALNGFQITATPSATFSAHIQGGIDVVIAAGGVDVTVQLLDVQIPMVVSTTIDISTAPEVCGATVNFDAKAQLALGSGGGSVDLVARFGVCPFCDHESMNLFRWGPLVKSTSNLFEYATSNLLFSLPAGSCKAPLDVTLSVPQPSASVFAGIPTPTLASAQRPPTAVMSGSGPGFELPTPVDCQYLTWTSSDSGATFSPSPTGCSPTVTFSDAAAGTQQTLTVTATDAFGETGSASASVSVASASGPVPVITFPLDQTPPMVITGNGTGGLPVTLQGTIYGGVGDLFVQWSETGTDANGNWTSTTLSESTVPSGSAVPVSLSWFFSNGPHTVVLLVNDSLDQIAAVSTKFGIASVQ